jgi:zinc protease
MAASQHVRAVILALFSAFVFVSTSARAEAPVIGAQVTTFTLDNGLQVVVIPDHRTPAVSHMIWYRAGAAEDPPGTSGIAHFLEHLLFKGTKAHPAGEFEARIRAIGGNQNASTSNDYTEYHQSVSREHLGLVMEYEADRMVNVDISEEAVRTEREVILEERRMRVENDPGARLGEALSAALFQNSPYGVPVIGWAHEMAKLDRADALAFYDRYYTPNNAVVVVAGDVTEAEVRKLAEATYGKVARRSEPPPRVRPQEPEPGAARTVTLSDPRVTQPSLRRTYLVPSYTTAAPGEAAALDILSEILGGGSSSRLFKGLVLGKAIATTAGASYRSSSLDDTTFSVYGVPRGDITLDAVMAGIDAVIAETIEEGVTEDEVNRARKRFLAGAIYAQDSQGTLARVFAEALMTGQTVDAVKNWPAELAKVTAADVNAVARKYLDTRRSVTGYLINKPGEGRS